jgi:hypothetical protein
MTRITTHPGEILREEFMVPYVMGAHALATGAWRAGQPDNRITGYHRASLAPHRNAGYGVAPVPVFWHQTTTLAEFAACLQLIICRLTGRRRHRGDGPPEGGSIAGANHSRDSLVMTRVSPRRQWRVHRRALNTTAKRQVTPHNTHGSSHEHR